MSLAGDKVTQLGEHDTITRQEWRRLRGLCEECGADLKPNQVERGGRFCTPRCSGRNVARREYGPAIVPFHPTAPVEEEPVGIVHDLVGDEFDTATGERNDYPLPARCEQCGQPYRRKRKNQRFCSSGCGGRWHAQHRPPRPAPIRAVGPGGLTPDQQLVMAEPGLRNLLAQAVAVADTWHFEARIGDVALTLTRPAP